jgi:uncharacterized protein (DUF1015 family)
MANIKPFRSVRYHPAKVPDLSRVIAQPYDRIRYGLQERYYELSPYNVVRLTRGKELPTDLPERLAGPNVYTRAKAYYGLWHVEEVLVRDPEPALYVYHQTYSVAKRTQTRRGVVAALELSHFGEGIVLPHERTHAGPKIDRLRLLHTLGVNLGQVFVLHSDPANRVGAILEQAIAGREPEVDVAEMYESDVQQRLWVVIDRAAIEAVQEEMSAKRNLIIADGHHRYETALTYRDEMRGRHPGAPAEAAFNYRMVCLVGMDDPGLIILPTHREVFDHPGVAPDEILRRAAGAFEVLPVPDIGACFAAMAEREREHAFGLYAGGSYCVLVLRDAGLIEAWIEDARSPAWKSLDVTIAHRIILERLAGLPAEAVEAEAHVRYHRDPLLPVENVDHGRGDFCLFLNPTRIDQVKACAAQGEPMPQKSTDFYPKMVSGLTMMAVGAEDRL